MAIKYINIVHAMHSKIYPNLDFWFENIPAGNPVPEFKSRHASRENVAIRVTR
jgi:hypothetical protein